MNEPVYLPPVAASPAAMIAYAMEKGADIEKLEQLFALQQKWEANEARKAYVAAMARFKKNPPTIYKDKDVAFGTTRYSHATLGEVCEKIVAGLAEHGFSHRWIPSRGEGGMVEVACVITHELGHSEETKLSAGLDTSGGKNNIQSMISTKTYLERHSLLAATGLATKDMEDDDGRGAEPPQRAEPKPGVRMPQARKDAEAQEPADQNVGATESAPAAPAASAPVNDAPATAGEKAFISKKLANLDPPKTTAEACESNGLPDFDHLTKSGFEAIKLYVADLSR